MLVISPVVIKIRTVPYFRSIVEAKHCIVLSDVHSLASHELLPVRNATVGEEVPNTHPWTVMLVLPVSTALTRVIKDSAGRSNVKVSVPLPDDPPAVTATIVVAL